MLTHKSIISGRFEDWCVEPGRLRKGSLGCLLGTKSLWKAHACRIQRRRPFDGVHVREAVVNVGWAVEAETRMVDLTH